MDFTAWYEQQVKGFFLKDIYGMPWFAWAAILLLVAGSAGLTLLSRRRRGHAAGARAFAAVFAVAVGATVALAASAGALPGALVAPAIVAAAAALAAGAISSTRGVGAVSVWHAGVAALLAGAIALLVAANWEWVALMLGDWYVAAVAGLFALTLFALIAGGRQRWDARTLSYAALCLAVSFVLSTIRLFRMSEGGSVVLCAILPITAFALYRGVWQGSVVAVAYGLLEMTLGAWIVHPVQGALDYLVAFLMLAMGGGIARKLPVPEKYKMVCALAIGGALRWAVHTLAGVVFFASNAPEGQPVWAYSAVYNAFLFPEVALASIVSLLPAFARLFKPLREDAV